MSLKKAMITVEVLISLLILFMVIATSTATIKQLNIIRNQQINHEDFYMAVLNIKDYIDDTICLKNNSLHGQLQQFDYNATCTIIEEKRKYEKKEGSEGNIGIFLISLYKVTLDVKKQEYIQSYIYYKMVAK